MAFQTKNWQNAPSSVTPLSAAAMTDLEQRVTDWGDARFFDSTFGDGAATSFTFYPPTRGPYPLVQVVNIGTGQVEDVQVAIAPGSPDVHGNFSAVVTISAEDWLTFPPGLAAYHITIVG